VAVGKWKTCFWFSTFPSALVVGAVGMWESRLPLARLPKGLVERVGSLPLAFHAFHSPGIPTALSHRGFRQRANKLSLAFCIRRAASVSLLIVACCCSMSAVIPFFKDFSHWGNDVSFS